MTPGLRLRDFVSNFPFTKPSLSSIFPKTLKPLYSLAMAETTELIRHIELYVDTSRSPTEQAASLNSIISLVKSDFLTIEVLVKEMRMYLTTTDNVIRARGILLLAEVLTGLASKPLDNATIHSLIGFFTDRLIGELYVVHLSVAWHC